MFYVIRILLAQFWFDKFRQAKKFSGRGIATTGKSENVISPFAFAPNLSTSISFVGDVVGVQTFAANNLSSLVFFLRVAIFQAAFGGPATVASVPVAAANANTVKVRKAKKRKSNC